MLVEIVGRLRLEKPEIPVSEQFVLLQRAQAQVLFAQELVAQLLISCHIMRLCNVDCAWQDAIGTSYDDVVGLSKWKIGDFFGDARPQRIPARRGVRVGFEPRLVPSDRLPTLRVERDLELIAALGYRPQRGRVSAIRSIRSACWFARLNRSRALRE